MKTVVLWLVARLIAGSPTVGQEIAGNPFPETGEVTDSTVFDTGNEVALTGLITQEVTRADSPSSGYLYFRMDVRDSTSGLTANWAVRMLKPSYPVPSVRGPVLVSDYSPDMARLKSGMTITVRGYRARDGSSRLRLVPFSGPDTLAGVRVSQP